MKILQFIDLKLSKFGFKGGNLQFWGEKCEEFEFEGEKNNWPVDDIKPNWLAAAKQHRLWLIRCLCLPATGLSAPRARLKGTMPHVIRFTTVQTHRQFIHPIRFLSITLYRFKLIQLTWWVIYLLLFECTSEKRSLRCPLLGIGINRIQKKKRQGSRRSD